MSIDKSLRRKNSLARTRNVLTRTERIAVLMGDERWKEGQSPFNLPKVRVLKVSKKAKAKAKDEDEAGLCRFRVARSPCLLRETRKIFAPSRIFREKI